MSEDIEVRIARAEREYERIASAAYLARTRLKSISSDASVNPLEVARARSHLTVLEGKRARLRRTLDALESESDLS